MFADPILFPKVITVVAKEDDDGIVSMRPVFQGIQHAADLMIYNRHTREIGLDTFRNYSLSFFCKKASSGYLGNSRMHRLISGTSRRSSESTGGSFTLSNGTRLNHFWGT